MIRLHKNYLSRCFVTLLLFFAVAQSNFVWAQNLPLSVVNLLRERQIPDDSIGIVVLPANAAKISGLVDKSLNWQGNKSMQPASTIKVVSSLAALELLGPGYRGFTVLSSTNALKDSKLQGNLVLQGRANPDLTRAHLLAMLNELKASGVTQIEGDLLIDRNWFMPARPDLGVAAFDETPEFVYNFIPDALSLNFNLVDLRLEATSLQIAITLREPLNGIELVNQLTLNDLPCKDWEGKWQTPKLGSKPNQIVFSGSFPRQCLVNTQMNLLDRTVFAEHLFSTLWKSIGGQWQGKARELDSTQASALPPLTEWVRRESRPLSELIRDVNKRSDNAVSRLIYAALGATGDRSEPTQVAADRQLGYWLRSKTIDPTGVVMDNGSGLSRLARISPLQLAQVLQAGYASRWAPEFLASLPVVGVDGSMRRRLNNSVAAANARIKTGSINHVSAVAGYVTDRQQQPWVTVVMINHPKLVGRDARDIQDAVIEWVAR